MRAPLTLAIAVAAACMGLSSIAAAQSAPPDSTTQAPDTAPQAPVAGTPPDTTAQVAPSGAAAPADTTLPSPVSAARRARIALGRDSDRLEVGAAVVDGPFDFIGTFGYHRFARSGGPFENWVHVEISFGATKFLNEGTVSAAYLLRPLRTIHRGWRLQPILEVGPGGHLVVQVAEVQGFGESAFHAHAYLKTQAIAGLESVIGKHWGVVARGRLSVPAHHPLDYAQIALFFR
jgi:hypothetical protein